MDFFQNQDDAHRQTRRLIVYFVLAVALIVVATYLTLGLGASIAMSGLEADSAPSIGAIMTSPVFMAVVAIGTVAFIGCGTLFKLAALRGGGPVIAERMGGTLIHANTGDPDQRRILNVVEEMAIASGIPAPPVYLMQNEDGINAFAAGYSPEDAAIGVTQGCVRLLNRDELQGVIAHEFSHILNGDMRLNIRLIGIIHGILMIGLIGHMLTRMWYLGAMSGSSRRNRGSNNGGAVILAIIVAGYLLMLIGFVGTFFGSLIKASVSRQREFLADASAVQFTRNPDGIGNALRRIGGHAAGARVSNPHATELSHMFFGEAVTSGLSSMFATHPPLENRIQQILPNWDGTWLGSRKSSNRKRNRQPRRHRSATMPGPSDVTPVSALDSPGTGPLSAAHVEVARDILSQLPAALREAAHDPWSAQAVILALLLDRHDADARARQISAIETNANRALRTESERLAQLTDVLPASARLPLVETTISSLRDMPPTHYPTFKQMIIACVGADGSLGLFEWILHRLLLHQLAPAFEATPRPTVRYRSLDAVAEHAARLLTMLAYAGHENDDDASRAFARATESIGASEWTMLARDACGFRDADRALTILASLSPAAKRSFVDAALLVVTADSLIHAREYEVLRAILSSIGVPMPPQLHQKSGAATDPR